MAPPVAACHKQMSSIPTRKGEGKRSLTFAHCFRSGVEIIRITSLREGARLPLYHISIRFHLGRTIQGQTYSIMDTKGYR